MLKQTLALVGLTLSLSANAAIVDNGTITTDTATGLDWLDLTETNGRSYYDISSKLDAGEEFAGWRYATGIEVQDLWKNLGMAYGTNRAILTSDVVQYASFIRAVNLLGNTFNEFDSAYDYGVAGNTGDTWSYQGIQYVNAAGMSHVAGRSETVEWREGTGNLRNGAYVHVGSYLVAPSAVPVPAAAWLFGTALLGLVGVKRRHR